MIRPPRSWAAAAISASRPGGGVDPSLAQQARGVGGASRRDQGDGAGREHRLGERPEEEQPRGRRGRHGHPLALQRAHLVDARRAAHHVLAPRPRDEQHRLELGVAGSGAQLGQAVHGRDAGVGAAAVSAQGQRLGQGALVGHQGQVEVDAVRSGGRRVLVEPGPIGGEQERRRRAARDCEQAQGPQRHGDQVADRGGGAGREVAGGELQRWPPEEAQLSQDPAVQGEVVGGVAEDGEAQEDEHQLAPGPELQHRRLSRGLRAS